MLIYLLEPYDTGSHRAWVRGIQAHSTHDVVPFTLDGRFWKWRMHGGAVTLASALRQASGKPDLLLASDMLDLTTLLSLTRDLAHDVPVALYMHENQLTYPPRPGEKRDLHYGFINYASMLCADKVFFNSRYHLDAWFDELPRLLKHFPDHNELHTVRALRERSEVLPLGLDLSTLDTHRPAEPRHGPALILWNHRWEYDKSPEGFLEALYALAERGLDFRVVLLGEVFVRVPPVFEEAQRRLGDRIVQFGYVERFAEYARWLWRSDVVVSTAIHDFFGAAVVEAIYCDTLPILPERLAYPQFVSQTFRERCLYRDSHELVARLQRAIERIDETRATSLRTAVACYDWSHMAALYDRRLEELVHEARASRLWSRMDS
ncbi:MAG: tRNA-queuosine alpha-mannosyltransferase domain-containing protein [Anaerolineae bacterium]